MNPNMVSTSSSRGTATATATATIGAAINWSEDVQ